MAILRGFPPSNTISPSVRITEKDLSFVLPEQSFHRAGLVGFASKGPINIPVVIRTKRALNTVFGFPHPDVGDPYLIYAAEQYLQISNELYVVRVGDQDAVSDERAQIAEVAIPAAGGQIIVTSDVAGTYSFPVTSFFRWKLNGILASKTLVVLADDLRDGDDEGQPYTTVQLVEDLNVQLDSAIDGIEFFTTDGDEIGVRTTFAYGPDATLEFVSVQNAIYGPETSVSGITGLGQGMTHAQTTSANDDYNPGSSGSDWNFFDLSEDDLMLEVIVDGTDNVLIDGVVQQVDLGSLAGTMATTADIVELINQQITDGDIPGGFAAVGGSVANGPELAGPNDTTVTFDLSGYAEFSAANLTLVTLHAGKDARILVKTTSTANAVFDFDGVTGKGTSPEGSSDDVNIQDLAIISGGVGNNETTFTITADTPGIDGNNTLVRIKNNLRESVFTIEVYNNGVQVESWGNLTKDSTSRFYVETFLSLVSDFIRAVDETGTIASPADGDYTLSGGSDGIPSDPDDQDGLLIGNNLGFTGLYALSEPEQIEIDLIAVPGHASTGVVMAMIDLCENYRQDCLAIIDPPFGLTVKEIVNWQNGSHPLNTTRFDSDFAALYWPWVKIRDTYNNVDVWVPPSGSVMATIARSDAIAAPWFAPAGELRGIVPGITDVFSRPTLEERDLMYGNRNAINPIVQFNDVQDFVVWGQKTLQRRPTALDRVNVRRLMFVLEKRIRAASRSLLFEPHDEIFHERFIKIATRILSEVQIGRGLTDFIIQADFELNTPDVIDRNEFRARIGIQPTRAVEFIFIEFSIHRTGSFTENSDTF